MKWHECTYFYLCYTTLFGLLLQFRRSRFFTCFYCLFFFLLLLLLPFLSLFNVVLGRNSIDSVVCCCRCGCFCFAFSFCCLFLSIQFCYVLLTNALDCCCCCCCIVFLLLLIGRMNHGNVMYGNVMCTRNVRVGEKRKKNETGVSNIKGLYENE